MAADVSFLEATNQVCRDLPDGWQISIELERNAGSITLTDPGGDEVDFPSNHDVFEQTLRDALEYAIAEQSLADKITEAQNHGLPELQRDGDGITEGVQAGRD